MPTLLPGNRNVTTLNFHNKNLALLGAMSLFLSAVEYMIPKPLPFLRIGLANLPLMLALDIFPLPAFLILVNIKVLGQALITGTLFSYIFLFSLTGTFLSALIMYFLRRISGLYSAEHGITFIGIGTAGALVSNLSQLALAYVFIFRGNIVYIVPLFLFTGLVTGIILGVFCEVFAKKSRWYLNEKLKIKNGQLIIFKKQKIEEKECLTENLEQSTNINDQGKQKACLRRNFFENAFSARALFIAGLLIMPSLVFNPNTEYRVVQFLFFTFLVWLSGKRTDLPLNIFIITCIVIFNLIIPYGRVIFSAGAFKVTSGALTAGLHRAVTLCALVMLSKVTIRQDLKIPGSFGELLSKSLCFFSALMDRRNHITAKNFSGDIDILMLKLSEDDIKYSPTNQSGTKPAGYVILITSVIISWLPWVKIIFNP